MGIFGTGPGGVLFIEEDTTEHDMVMVLPHDPAIDEPRRLVRNTGANQLTIDGNEHFLGANGSDTTVALSTGQSALIEWASGAFRWYVSSPYDQALT